jgi:hypothetical protein
MKVGVTDTAEQDFDLHVAISWIATGNFGGSQSGCGTGSGIGFRVVGGWLHLVNPPIGFVLV